MAPPREEREADWELLFQLDPFMSSKKCRAMSEANNKDPNYAKCHWKSRRETVIKNLALNKDIQVPPAFAILNRGYLRLNKKLTESAQADELAKEAQVAPYDVHRFFVIHRRVDRQYKPEEWTPTEEECKVFHWSAHQEIPFVFDIRRLYPLEDEVLDFSTSRDRLTERRRAQFGNMFWFEETPLPFNNSYEWETWTSDQVLEFASQFVTPESLNCLRAYPIKGSQLVKLDYKNRDLVNFYKLSDDDVSKIRLSLAEMNAFKRSVERCTKALN